MIRSQDGRFPVKAILFDLDGTLVDSVADLAAAVNFAITQLGWPAKTESQVGVHVGNGVKVLLERVMGKSPDVSEVILQKAQKLFEDHYRSHCLDHTVAYPGVKETLGYLSSKSKAVVTNKPEEFTRKILEGLGLIPCFQVILGGDSFPIRKPAPDPLWEAARRFGVSPAETLVVGDSAIDVRAGKAAGMPTCAVAYGLTRKEDLTLEKPDRLIDEFVKLKDLIE